MILNTAAYYQDLKEKMIVDEFHTHKKRLFRMDEEYVALQNNIYSNVEPEFTICKYKKYKGGLNETKRS